MGNRWFRIVAVCLFLFVTGAAVCPQVKATPNYGDQTGKGCIFCHRYSTGGQLKNVGFAFIRNGYRYPISASVLNKAERLQGPLHKTLRFIAGYLHLLTGIILFSVLFFIHFFIRSNPLKIGISKLEGGVGWGCMGLLTLTGTYLAWMRMDRLEQFYRNSFGLILSIKIVLFIFMAVVTLVARRPAGSRFQKRGSGQERSGFQGKQTGIGDLSRYDGTGKEPAHIAFHGKIYDVSSSPHWKGGDHFGRHKAGSDLTEAIKGAPHGAGVLSRMPCLGDVVPAAAAATADSGAQTPKVSAYVQLGLMFLILACITIWRYDFPVTLIPESRAGASAGGDCVSCHRDKTPAVFNDWQSGMHAKVGVECYKCHRANTEAAALTSHLKHDPRKISAVVSPLNCGGCHPLQAEQFARSKHAGTIKIISQMDNWLKDGMNNTTERITGCYACHGTSVKVRQGAPVDGTWPNVGIGRVNPDGSRGSCSSCHTRHRFSISEARKPEACDQCHLGPDHPQIEIYAESKHGSIYQAEKDQWCFDPEDRRWTAGRDFRAPTCAACHISAAGKVPASHDITERLAWETQTPLTIRPRDFAPLPAKTDWRKEREKMKTVCGQCHSERWRDDHFKNFDAAVVNYNENYYVPIEAEMDSLYAAGLLTRSPYFDEPLEWEFYELWHHEGRRARMGAAMMAPDYAWWHGFYELKHRFGEIQEQIQALKSSGRPSEVMTIPGKNNP